MSKATPNLQASVTTIITHPDGSYNADISTMSDINVPQLIEVLRKEIEALEFMMQGRTEPVWPKTYLSFDGKIKL